MRVLVIHPGATWSTLDVYNGLTHGLREAGVTVIPYRLDQRLDVAHSSLFGRWRKVKKSAPETPKPTQADILYQAGVGALEMALREDVDAVIVVSAMYLHVQLLPLFRKAGLRVFVLFTETPYDLEQELKVASLVDGCWTNERSSVAAFRAVNPRSGYLPHAWHPLIHRPGVSAGDDAVAAHDVVFVGTAFAERIAWFEAIDWSGIDLGLYGSWDLLRPTSPLRPFVRAEQVTNPLASALYRRAAVGLNLYRTSKGFGRRVESITHAESLNPRAYELAACGVFHLSEYRAEVADVFGDLVPTFTTPTEAAALIRVWLRDVQGRARVAASLPATVAEYSWSERAQIVVKDLAAFLATRAA